MTPRWILPSALASALVLLLAGLPVPATVGAVPCYESGPVRVGSWTIVNPPDVSSTDPLSGNESRSQAIVDFAVSPLDSDVLYVIPQMSTYFGQAPMGYLYRSDDAGCSWNEVLTHPGFIKSVTVANDSSQSVYVVVSSTTGGTGIE
ncbi:MAG: hypothetical protein ACRD1T_28005, partial [Acidimicrobiia bacterium]